MPPRNIAFSSVSDSPFLEQSEEKWYPIKAVEVGIPADLAKAAEDLQQRHRDLTNEELWEQGQGLGLRVLDVLGDGFNFYVFVGSSIRKVSKPTSSPT